MGVFGCTLGVIIPILSALAALGLILANGVRYLDREFLNVSVLAFSTCLFDGANGVLILLLAIQALGPPGVKLVGALVLLDDAPVEALRRSMIFFEGPKVGFLMDWKLPALTASCSSELVSRL